MMINITKTGATIKTIGLIKNAPVIKLVSYSNITKGFYKKLSSILKKRKDSSSKNNID